jgi:hypothetical protein
MSLPRVSLGITAAAFTGFGAWLLLRPQALGRVDVQLPTARARAEIRAFYGGLEIGLGLFFAAAAARPAWHRPALVVQAASLGGAAIGRAVSMAADPPGDPLIRLLAVLETTAAVGGLAALARTAPDAGGPPETRRVDACGG